MTVAADILMLYAREWNIDSTPTLRDLCVSTGPSEWNLGTDALPSEDPPTTGGDDVALAVGAAWLLRSAAVGTRIQGVRLLECRHLCSTNLQWTTATVEVSHWTGVHLRRMASTFDAGLHFPSEYTDPSTKSDRAVRAVRAVKDLAKWLGTTEPNAADLAGNYKRSYYNWLKGMQPYAATTLNLYEAHALVASLVDAFGDERATRMWLDAREPPGNWQSLLSTREGRAQLARAASAVLFRPIDRPVWSPDDDLAHDVTPGPRGRATDQAPPVVISQPDNEQSSDQPDE
jgi:hypothetical protein